MVICFEGVWCAGGRGERERERERGINETVLRGFGLGVFREGGEGGGGGGGRVKLASSYFSDR